MNAIVFVLLAGFAAQGSEVPRFEAEQIFPPVEPQTHAPGIVELPNGDLLASWYGDPVKDVEGSSDAAVIGARKTKGASTWSRSFVLADRPGFPDCNTCMMVDRRGALWLFWPTILANSWESSILTLRTTTEFSKSGEPHWRKEGFILLRPADFGPEALRLLGDRQIKPPRGVKATPEAQRAKLNDQLYQRMGWACRCKPTVLPSGRIILPLYTDTFAISIMAISDDDGATWYASKPLIGFGNIQPTVLRRDDGTLVAYMRENGPLNVIRYSESKDDGMTWSPVLETDLPNPGAGIDAVRLSNGHWALVYNDHRDSRATLAVSISDDEGKTWKTTRHLEKHKAGRYHYPAVIQGHDGTIHAIYSTFIAPEDAGEEAKAKRQTLKGIKHVAFNEAWVSVGD